MWTLVMPIIGIVVLAYLARIAILRQLDINEHDKLRDVARRNRRYIAKQNWEYVQFDKES